MGIEDEHPAGMRYVLNPKTQEICLTKMIFLGEVVSGDSENNSNNYNVVNDSKRNDEATKN